MGGRRRSDRGGRKQERLQGPARLRRSCLWGLVARSPRAQPTAPGMQGSRRAARPRFARRAPRVLVRYGLTVASASIWVVCAINVVGCFALGLLTTAGGELPTDMRAGIGTGVLGGLTTFSTFGVQAVGEADAGRLAAASAYVVVSVAGGVAAAAGGWAVGRALTG